MSCTACNVLNVLVSYGLSSIAASQTPQTILLTNTFDGELPRESAFWLVLVHRKLQFNLLYRLVEGLELESVLWMQILNINFGDTWCQWIPLNVLKF